MKRASLVAPVLLIGIGVLFLANNLRPDLPMLETVAIYWPLLLVVWGVIRLLEIAWWAVSRKPLPTSGISGGEWVLIVFICLIGSGAFAAHRFHRGWPGSRLAVRGVEIFGEKFDYSFSENKPSSKTPRVMVENLRGNARIIGTDSELVSVSGRKTVQAMTQVDADKANERSPLELRVNGDQVTVRMIQDNRSDQRVLTDLEISVPRGASIEARGRSGDFDISNVDGEVSIESENSGVRLQNIARQVRIEVNRCDIIRAVNIKSSIDLKGNHCQDVEMDNIAGQVTVAGNYSGELTFRRLEKPLEFKGQRTEFRVERIPGDLRLALGHLTGNNLIGPIHLEARTRDVQLRRFTGPVDISVDRGDIEMIPFLTPLSRVEVRSGSGDIEFAAPAGAGFEITAVSKRGAVENEYGPPLTEEEDGKAGSGGTIRGKIGQGPDVRLSTDRGAIRIRKSSASDNLPAEMPPSRMSDVPAPPAPPRTPKAPVAPSELKPVDQ